MSDHYIPTALRNFSDALVRVKNHKGKLWVTREVIKERKQICGRCHHKKFGVCQLCKCAITVKKLLNTEDCPASKWPERNNDV